jgi:PP-loop superfamily ATP-utilizing enzyme
MLYVGVDVGESCRAAMMNQEGKVTIEFSFNHDSEQISRLASMLTKDDRVVMVTIRTFLSRNGSG